MAGQIIKRGDRTYLVRIYQGKDAQGKRKYANKTIHGTRKDAQAYLNKALTDLDNGTFTQPSKETVDAYLDRWLETVAKQRVKPRTYSDYQEILRLYTRPAFGNIRLVNMGAPLIQKTYSDMIEKGLSGSTIRKLHNVLHSAFKQAERWRLIPRNPVDLVDPPRTQKKEMHAMSPEESRKFLKEAQSNKWYPLFLLAIDSGMRPGEILALKWEDINFDSGTVSIRRTLASDRKQLYIAEPKTKGSKRIVNLSAGTLTALKTHRSNQAQEKLLARSVYIDNGLVFANQTGGFLDQPNLVKRHFKPLLKQAGLSHTIRFYDLRHTCATLLLSASTNPKVVAERLGHASVTLTLDTYSHVLPTMQEDAAIRMERMLF